MPNNATLPTRQELCQLPRWAVVAFAARCARRVHRLVYLPDTFLADVSLQWAEDSVRIAEIAASIATAQGITAGDVQTSTASPTDADTIALYAERSVRAASNTAQVASDAAYTPERAADPAHSAAYHATLAADLNGEDSGLTASGIRDDFDRLLQLSRSQKWNRFTPVPPSVFDPLLEQPTENSLDSA